MMLYRLFGILVLIVVANGCHKSIESPGSSGPGQAAAYQPRTLQELAEFLSKQLPGIWEVEKNNRVNGRERDNEGNWKWSCIIINNPKDNEVGRQIAQEMGTIWSSQSFVVAYGNKFILISHSKEPEIKRIANLLNLTLLEPPKDIRTFVVQDSGLIWNGLTLERPK